MNLAFKDKLSLRLQHYTGWITFPVWGTALIAALRFFGRYRIPEIRQIRKTFKELKKQAEGPILICSNHLTKIDSAVLNWSFASVWSYMRSFKVFSWNLPERANFYHNRLLRIVCYLASCVPIDRGGSREAVKKSLDKVAYLLKKGHPVTIFPEGGRSRTGRIDLERFTYGVGRLVNQVKDCNVLCVYLRGHTQENYSEIPPRGSQFYLNMELIKPKSEHSGLKATKDVANQIIEKLVHMEQNYFASVRQ